MCDGSYRYCKNCVSSFAAVVAGGTLLLATKKEYPSFDDILKNWWV